MMMMMSKDKVVMNICLDVKDWTLAIALLT